MTAPFPFNQVTTVELPNRNDKLRILFLDHAIKHSPDNKNLAGTDRAQQLVLNYLHKHGLPAGFDPACDFALIYSRESLIDSEATYLDVRFVSMRDFQPKEPSFTAPNSEYHRRALIEINNERKVVWYRYVDIGTIEFVENGIVFQTHYKSIVMHLNADGSVEAE